ncbi:metallopeptidase TldD-related protein, partial [Gottfriedia sp. NPDC056225]|uniref:metallopeptidase TldD-related protein n=1 Tax=Gottfriedia sp. NPDC056225 TaxID=3345751 RepID=UPI0035DCB86F
LKEKRKIVICEDQIIYSEKERYYVFSYNIVNSTKNVILSDYFVMKNIKNSNLLDVFNRIEDEIKFSLASKINIDIECIDDYDLYFNNCTTGIFFHEFIGHMLEADHYYKSPISDKYDVIFNEHLTVYENFNLDGRYDDLGNEIISDLELLKNGRINKLMNCVTSRYLYNQEQSGNSIQGNNVESIYPRMQHMYICSGSQKFEELISKTHKGLYIEKINLGEVNTFTGDFIVEVEIAFLIENGKRNLPVEPLILYFNINELAKKRILLDNTLKRFYNLCGKKGAVVKVEYTVPSILIKSSVG